MTVAMFIPYVLVVVASIMAGVAYASIPSWILSLKRAQRARLKARRGEPYKGTRPPMHVNSRCTLEAVEEEPQTWIYRCEVCHKEKQTDKRPTTHVCKACTPDYPCPDHPLREATGHVATQGGYRRVCPECPGSFKLPVTEKPRLYVIDTGAEVNADAK